MSRAALPMPSLPPADQIWPQLTPDTAAAFVALIAGRRPDPRKFAVVDVNYYHRQSYGTAGSTKLTWFNTNISDGVCNFNQNILPPERPMLVKGIRLMPEDVDTDGTRIAGGSLIGFHATTPTQYTRAEEIRTVFQAGFVKVRFGDIEAVNAHGLTRFPPGAGIALDAALSTNSATTGVYQAVNLNNGAPHMLNQNVMSAPFAWLPGVPVTFETFWPTLLTVTAKFTLKAEMFGTVIIPLAAR